MKLNPGLHMLGACLCAGSLAFGQLTVPGIKKMTLLSTFQTGSGHASVWGWVGPDAQEYALFSVMRPGGVSIVSLQDPKNPKQVAFASSPDGTWHEMKTYRQYMYKCADQGNFGLQIFNLSGLPAGIKEEPRYTAGGVTQCHNLWLDSTHSPPLLYLQQNKTEGVLILSIANPAAPVELARLRTECHDGFARGNRVWISTQFSGTWDTWDISKVTAPLKIASVRMDSLNGTLGEPVKTISHNVWPSEDGKYMFTTEEVANTTLKSWDISDELHPKYLAKYVAVPGVIAHNALVNKYLYVAHYSAGLRVLDIRDPRNLVEIAYHKPNASNGAGGGSWGAYCWFPSGLLIHAESQQGLFVLDPDADIKIIGRPDAVPAIGGTSPFSITGWEGGLRFQLPQNGAYVLSLHTLGGREVLRLRGMGKAGLQAWDAGRLAEGRYVARLSQDGKLFRASLPLH